MSMQRDFDKVLEGQDKIGHPVWPPFQASLNVGDVGTWNSVPKEWTTAQSYRSMAGHDYSATNKGSGVRSEVKNTTSIQGGFRVDGDGIQVEDGIANGEGRVTFTKSNQFYLYAPYAKYEEASGILALARDVFERLDRKVSISTHVVYKVFRAENGGVFLGSTSSEQSTQVDAAYKSAENGTYKASFSLKNTSAGLISHLYNPEHGGQAEYAFRIFRFDVSAKRRRHGNDLTMSDITIDPFI